MAALAATIGCAACAATFSSQAAAESKCGQPSITDVRFHFRATHNSYGNYAVRMTYVLHTGGSWGDIYVDDGIVPDDEAALAARLEQGA